MGNDIETMRVSRELGISCHEAREVIGGFVESLGNNVITHTLATDPLSKMISGGPGPVLRLGVPSSRFSSMEQAEETLMHFQGEALTNPSMARLMRGDRGQPLQLVLTPAASSM